jgi:threonine dehydrogenase-like Zn-dependent dehydrogenase
LLSENPWVPPGNLHLVLGHECLARVESLGPGVSGIEVGQLVVPAVRRPSSELLATLPKEQGIRVDMLAFGAFTERGIVWEHGFSLPWWLDEPRYLFPVSPELRDVAIFTEPLAVSEKGVNEATLLNRARLSPDAWPEGEAGSTQPPLGSPRVLVTGLGPIGFAAVISCRARGWETAVYGRDPEESFRAGLVREFGATYLPAQRKPLEVSDVEAEGWDLVLECTGSDEVMLASALATRSRGAIVWLGSDRRPEPRSFNLGLMIRDGLLRNHLHIGCVNAAPRDFTMALEILARMEQIAPQGVRNLFTARVGQDEALWHYEHRQPQGIKTVVDFA